MNDEKYNLCTCQLFESKSMSLSTSYTEIRPKTDYFLPTTTALLLSPGCCSSACTLYTVGGDLNDLLKSQETIFVD